MTGFSRQGRYRIAIWIGGRLLSYPVTNRVSDAKAQQLEIEQVEAAKFDKLLRRKVWIRKGVERGVRAAWPYCAAGEMRNERAERRNVRQLKRTSARRALGQDRVELTDVTKNTAIESLSTYFTATSCAATSSVHRSEWCCKTRCSR